VVGIEGLISNRYHFVVLVSNRYYFISTLFLIDFKPITVSITVSISVSFQTDYRFISNRLPFPFELKTKNVIFYYRMINVDSVKLMIFDFQLLQNQINNKLGNTYHQSTPSNDEKLAILKQSAALNNILKQLITYSEKYLAPSKSTTF
jgi:hypothetical protein